MRFFPSLFLLDDDFVIVLRRQLRTHIRALLRDIVLKKSFLIRSRYAEERFFEVRLVRVVARKVDYVDEMSVVDDCGSVAEFLHEVKVVT